MNALELNSYYKFIYAKMYSENFRKARVSTKALSKRKWLLKMDNNHNEKITVKTPSANLFSCL